MKKAVCVCWILLFFAVLAGTAAAVPVQTEPDPAGVPDIGAAPDVITATDGAGGYLTTRDIILIVIIVFAVIGLAAVL